MDIDINLDAGISYFLFKCLFSLPEAPSGQERLMAHCSLSINISGTNE